MSNDQPPLTSVQAAVIAVLGDAVGFPLALDEVHERLQARRSDDVGVDVVAMALRELLLLGRIELVRWPGPGSFAHCYWVLPGSSWTSAPGRGPSSRQRNGVVRRRTGGMPAAATKNVDAGTNRRPMVDSRWMILGHG